MSKFLILCLCLVAGLANTVSATNGVRCELSVSQKDASEQNVLLVKDTVDLVENVNALGCFAAVSFDLKVTRVDTSGIMFLAHVNVHAPQPHQFSQRYSVEYGLPARISGLTGKGGAEYMLRILPIERIDIDTTGCSWRHNAPEDFKADPTAYTDLYYVPQTLGDYYWSSAKGIMDEEYKLLRSKVGFTMPGKYNIYLSPCQIHSVIWDDRFGMMVDPTRRVAFAVYSVDFNSAYPFLVNYAAVLHNFGYSPAFLSEGLAGYHSLASYEMKKILKDGRLVPLDQLLDTRAYFTADAVVADRIAATFVRYLVDTYDLGSFMELYRKADDLSLRESIESVYGKTVADLEKEWLAYVDTVSTKYSDATRNGGIAVAMWDYNASTEYSTEALRVAGSHVDSLRALMRLTQDQFSRGDFYSAVKYQEQLLAMDSTDARHWMTLASYHLMVGENDKAMTELARGRELDSTNQFIRFGQAFATYCNGDLEEAERLFEEVCAETSQSAGYVEARCLLGFLMLDKGLKQSDEKVLTLFTQVVQRLQSRMKSSQPSPYVALWLGVGHMGLGDPLVADDYFRLATVLETRPFYKAMLSLWRGKAADLKGERTTAVDFYNRVLALPAASYHQQEARRLLESPYKH